MASGVVGIMLHNADKHLHDKTLIEETASGIFFFSNMGLLSYQLDI